MHDALQDLEALTKYWRMLQYHRILWCDVILIAGHWKLSHTTKNFILQQGILLSNLGLFTFARNSPRLFASFGFTEAKPAFIAFTLFQLISSPIDEVSLSLNPPVQSHRWASEGNQRTYGTSIHIKTLQPLVINHHD